MKPAKNKDIRKQYKKMKIISMYLAVELEYDDGKINATDWVRLKNTNPTPPPFLIPKKAVDLNLKEIRFPWKVLEKSRRLKEG